MRSQAALFVVYLVVILAGLAWFAASALARL
jgi:hypothetical protein